MATSAIFLLLAAMAGLAFMIDSGDEDPIDEDEPIEPRVSV